LIIIFENLLYGSTFVHGCCFLFLFALNASPPLEGGSVSVSVHLYAKHYM